MNILKLDVNVCMWIIKYAYVNEIKKRELRILKSVQIVNFQK